jgi:hypothetical protein
MVGAVVMETVGVAGAGPGIGFGVSLLVAPARKSVLFGVQVTDALMNPVKALRVS